jgi:hypothetical protein
MMAQQYPFVRGFKIVTVAQAFGRRSARIVQHHHFGRYKFPVKAEAKNKNAYSGGDNPEAVHWFATVQSDDAKATCSCDGKCGPQGDGKMAGH